MDELICVGKIAKAHGIKGQVKFISYCSTPEDVFKYPYLLDESLNKYSIKIHNQKENFFIVGVSGVNSRNHAEEKAGIQLYITKSMLPEAKEDEFYHVDLVGLQVIDSNEILKGTIISVHNFGAGDIIEMKIVDSEKTIFLPFEKDFVLEVNLEKKFLVFSFNEAGIN